MTSTDRTILWGLWGTGRQAHELALDFRHVTGARLHAVGSRSVERAQAFAQRHAAPTHHGSLQALLGDPAIDVVYLASPNARHLEDSLACIEAGKAVLCEKPFALDAAQATAIAAAARQRRVFCMEAMWTRFIPAVAEARRLVAAGALGRIERIEGDFGYPAAPSAADARFSPAAGGGALLDRGVYLLSLAQQLLGEPVSVAASARIGPTGVDEHSACQLGYADGAVAQLSASLTSLGRNELVITGDRGRLCLHAPFYRAHRLSLVASPVPVASADGPPSWRSRLRDASTLKRLRRQLEPLAAMRSPLRGHRHVFAGNGYQFELQEVVRCLQRGALESEIMPLDDSIAVMAIADRVRAQWAARPEHA
ncbi:MAG TPA: Gfo/Idh/MocA family oxidoreductase [Methylibium sp.]|nr:Gfo/Idh/MocA family oxidoreductase [Methylibium sp.]